MDEGPNPEENEKLGGAAGPNNAVRMKKGLPGASSGKRLEMAI
jgi:hypothetical protein